MNLSDSLTLFGLFIVFLGLGLVIYASLFGLYLRLQLQLFPKLNEQFEQMLKRMDSEKETTQKHQNGLFRSEYGELHSLILQWEQSVYSGANYIKQLRTEKEISDWESRAIDHQGYIKALAYCSDQLRQSLSLPKKFSEQFLESGKD